MTTGVFLLVAASLAADPAGTVPSYYEHLKALEYFVGDWVIEGKIDVEGEFTGLADVAGQPLRQQMSYVWFKNKNFLATTIRDEENSAPSYIQVIGWDPQRKQITSMDFNSQGAYLKYVHIKRDNGWVMEGTSVYPGNVEGVYRAEIKIIDDKTFSHEGSGVMKQGGKKSKVTLSFVARKK